MKDHPNILHGPKYLFEFPKGTTFGQIIFDRISSYGDKVAQVNIFINALTMSNI